MHSNDVLDYIDTSHELSVLRRLEARIFEHERRSAAAGTSPVIKALSLKELESLPPRDVSIIEDAQKDPVYWTVRLLALEVGWKLYCKGGTDLMLKTCEELSTRFGAKLDKWWDGIGIPNDERGYWVA